MVLSVVNTLPIMANGQSLASSILIKRIKLSVQRNAYFTKGGY